MGNGHWSRVLVVFGVLAFGALSLFGSGKLVVVGMQASPVGTVGVLAVLVAGYIVMMRSNGRTE